MLANIYLCQANQVIMQRSILLLLLFVSVSCSRHVPIKILSDEQIPSIYIQRFDKEMFMHIESEGCSDLSALNRSYPSFYPIYAESLIGIGSIDSIGYEHRLFDYFRGEEIRQLYWDTLLEYDDMENIQSQLTQAFNRLHSYIPSITIPEFYVHVSGLNQSIAVGDGFISLSLDKYLGVNYPLYQTMFYSYERRHMYSGNIVQDYLTGWYYSEYPYGGEENRVLDHILYYGKLYYLHSLLLDKSEKEIMDFTESEERWFAKNEKTLWSYIVNEHKLYQNDQLFASKLLCDSPFTLFTLGEIPGRAGQWIGYQIIKSYVNSHEELSLHQLLSENDYKKILEDSKYDPS